MSKSLSRTWSPIRFLSEAPIRRCSSKSAFLKFWNIHRKTPVFESLFKKETPTLQHKFFPVNIPKFLEHLVFTEDLPRLLLFFLHLKLRELLVQLQMIHLFCEHQEKLTSKELVIYFSNNSNVSL